MVRLRHTTRHQAPMCKVPQERVDLFWKNMFATGRNKFKMNEVQAEQFANEILDFALKDLRVEVTDADTGSHM